MKTVINDPAWSKINWTALVVLIIGIINTMGWIPPAWQQHALSAATLLGPVLIIVFRTKFTAPNA